MAEKRTNTEGDFYFELIARELNGDISEHEKTILHEWVDGSMENRVVYEDSLKTWKITERKNTLPEFNTDTAWAKLSTKITEAENGQDQTGKTVKYIPAMIKIAAGILLMLGIFSLMKIFISDNPDAILITSGNEGRELYLPDSSKVWLNKNSKLTYFSDYNIEMRKVELEGEAFFEVKKSPDKKFEVSGLRSVTTVLGTSFSVRSVKGELREIVQVVTGRVCFADKNDVENNQVILTPGYKGELDSAQVTMIRIEDPNFMAWQRRKLSFENATIGQVVNTLEKYFEIEIEVADPLLLECRFTGTFNKPRPEEVLEVLTLSTNTSFRQSGGKYILQGKGCVK